MKTTIYRRKKEFQMPYDAQIHGFNGRTDSYEVEKELDVRKLLEVKTFGLNIGRYFEFGKNESKKEFDLVCSKYNVTLDDWSKSKVGYIEVEEVCSWTGSDIPDNWYCYSFLARKVYTFDWSENKWTNNPKNNWRDTIYLKVSSDLKGACCATIGDIIVHGKGVKGKKDLSYLYNDTYIEIPIGHFSVVTGIENCAKFIVDFFNR